MQARHSSPLHKNTAYFRGLFQILQSSFICTTATTPKDFGTDALLSKDFHVDEQCYVINIKRESLLFPGLQNESIAGNLRENENYMGLIDAFHEADADVDIDLRTETRSIREYLENVCQDMAFSLKQAIAYALRFKRLFQSLEGRQQLVRVKLQVVLIILNAYPDSNGLLVFFSDKSDFIMDVISIVQNKMQFHGDNFHIPLDILLKAIQCLESMIGPQDFASSIFSRYPWMMQSLGINRGQYMGLSPCLLRSACALLVSMEQRQALDREITKAYVALNSSDNDCSELLWAEHVLMFLLNLVNHFTAVPSLTENGLIASLLSVLKIRPVWCRSFHLTNCEILIIEIIETAITNHAPALASFRDHGGVAVILERLLSEVISFERATLLSEGMAQRLPSHLDVFIQELFSVLSVINQDMPADHLDAHELQQLYKSTSFSRCLESICNSPLKFSNSIVCAVLSFLNEVVGSDPSPPTLVAHVIANGLAATALRMFEISGVELHGDMLLALLNFCYTISLTSEGLNLVESLNPFRHVFAALRNADYVYPRARTLMHGLPKQLGAGAEELLRHYPSLTSLCFSEWIKSSEAVLGSLQSQHSPQLTDACVRLSSEYCLHMQFLYNLVSFLEPLLLRQSSVQHFLSKGGYMLCMRAIQLASGGPGELLSSAACIIESSSTNFGYVSVVNLLQHCVEHMAEVDAVGLCRQVFHSIKLSMTHLAVAVDAYADDVHSAQPGEVPFFPDIDFDIVFLQHFGNETTLRIDRLLDTVSRAPLHLDPNQMFLKSYENVLRTVVVLSHMLSFLGTCLSDGQLRSNCIDILSNTQVMNVMEALLKSVYVPIQKELARVSLGAVLPTKNTMIKLHPSYRLLIVCSEGAIVRESADDSSKKVCKLYRGVTLDAYERRCGANGSGMLKYRTALGWISLYRSSTSAALPSAEAQVQVVGVFAKDDGAAGIEITENAAKIQSTKDVNDFQRYAAVSARRAGSSVLAHFHSAIQANVMNLLAKNMSNGELGTVVTVDFHKFVPNFVHSTWSVLDTILSLSHDAVFIAPLDSWWSCAENESVTEAKVQMNEKYFVDFHRIPSYSSFGVDKVLLAVKAVELCCVILFENRRGSKVDLNIPMAFTMIYRQHLFERLMQSISTLFLVSYYQFDSNSLRDLGSLSHDDYLLSFPDNFHFISDDELDVLFDQLMALTSTVTEYADAMQRLEYVKYRMLLRNRRLLAFSNLESAVEMLRVLLTSLKQLDSVNYDMTKLCGPNCCYDQYVFRRQILLICGRYLPSFWSNKLLHTLSPPLIRSILELMGMYLSTLDDVIKFPLQHDVINGSNPTTRSKSLGKKRGVDRSHMAGDFASFLQHHMGLAFGGSTQSSSAVAAPIAIANDAMQSQGAVVASESTVSQLEEMGFSRRVIMHAVSLLHSNEVGELIPFLLENPFLADDLQDNPQRTSASVDGPAGEEAESTGGSEMTGENLTSAVAIGIASPNSCDQQSSGIVITERQLTDGMTSKLDEMSAMMSWWLWDEVPVESEQMNESVFEKLQWRIMSMNDLAHEKTCLHEILRYVYNTIPGLLVHLIKLGYNCAWAVSFMDSESMQNSTRELFTVMVCLDK